MLSTHPSYALVALCVCHSHSDSVFVDVLLLGLLDGALVQLQLYHPSVWNTQAQKVVASAGEGVQTIVCNKDCSLIVTTDTVGVVKLWRLVASLVAHASTHPQEHFQRRAPSTSRRLLPSRTLSAETEEEKRKPQT